MRSLDDILAISIERKGSEAVIFEHGSNIRSPADIAAIPDDRWLAEMTKGVFRAGFNWQVVEKLWPGFEKAFEGFDIDANVMMSDDRFDALCKDTSIIRYPQKIRSVQLNAAFIRTYSDQHGGFGAMIGAWPQTDFSGLLELLKKKGNRLGGTTGQYFLRSMGVNSYILGRDVITRLIAEGVIDKPPTSKSAMKAVQQAFNTWSDQSGRSITEISRILATSCG